jgi:NAD(P)-dependent dehydrogenase (short-subunit alcohol dehydrogenase family)
VVAPGPIETPVAAVIFNDTAWRAYEARISAVRLGKSADIVAAVGALVSKVASYVNDHTSAIHGGYTIAGLLA